MNITNKIDIAREYVSCHKDDNIIDWLPVGTDDQEKYLTIYENMCNDVYGEVVLNDEGDLLSVEISKSESKHDVTMFEWSIL